MKIPKFTEMINTYDIIALQETKLDDVDCVELPGYTIICQNRKKISRYRSGGTAFIFKSSLNHHIVPIKSDSKLIQWIRISKNITNTDEDVYCGNIYIPPQGSKFASQDPYLEIQTELNEHCSDNKYILLLGDFNSRTGTSPDNTITDYFYQECTMIVYCKTKMHKYFLLSKNVVSPLRDDRLTRRQIHMDCNS